MVQLKYGRTDDRPDVKGIERAIDAKVELVCLRTDDRPDVKGIESEDLRCLRRRCEEPMIAPT